MGAAMSRPRMLAADRLLVFVAGRGAQRVFSAAAAQGARLGCIQPDGQGFRAVVRGADLARVRQLADANGCTLTVLRRRGPGARLAALGRRPGILAGAALFFLLQGWLMHFVWKIDLSRLEESSAQPLRAALAEQGIREGAWLTAQKLEAAQQALELQLEDLGWLSLNFTGGCLFVEQTAREQPPAAAGQAAGALVAAAAGRVLQLRVDGGFPQVEVGQYVAQGQLLIAGQKQDRQGETVEQAAAGRVWAQIEMTYTAEQPLHIQAERLTGARRSETELLALGLSFDMADRTAEGDGPEESFAQQRQTVTLQPLTLGALALPASVRRTVYWEVRRGTQTLTPQTAQALARRACRLQLLREFPDAQLVEESGEARQTEDAVEYTAHYVFRADIARAGGT